MLDIRLLDIHIIHKLVHLSCGRCDQSGRSNRGMDVIHAHPSSEFQFPQKLRPDTHRRLLRQTRLHLSRGFSQAGTTW